MLPFHIICLLGAVLSFFIILQHDVNHDFKNWQNNIPVKHGVEGRIRALWLLVPLLLLLIPIHFKAIYLPIGALFFTYWLTFDSWYNTKRGLNIWSTGSVDKGDAISDRILRFFPKPVQIFIKVGGSAAFLFFYIKKLF